MHKLNLLLLTTALMFSPFYALAQEAEDLDEAFGQWQDEPESAWTLSGFSEAYGGAFFKKNRVGNDESMLELRNELSANRYLGSHFFSSRLQLVADKLDDPKVQLDVRELFINFNLSEHLALKVGQQVTTWGTGDNLFVNDFFPKDWQSLFAGRDDTYLKAPAPAIKMSVFSSALNIDFVWVPIFTPDTYITGERFVYFNPAILYGAQGMPELKDEKPKKELKNGQFHLRLSNTFSGTEVALYAYKGFFNRPMGYDALKQKYIFPALQAFGASVREDTFMGLISAEVAYWQSLDDKDGDKPFIPNNQVKAIVGIEKELVKNFTMGVQWMREQTLQYQAAKDNYMGATPIADEAHDMLTLRLRLQTYKQKITWSLFSFYSPNEKDSLSIAKVTYRHSDNWQFAIGANSFQGEKNYTQWGQFETNSNYFAQIKYNF